MIQRFGRGAGPVPVGALLYGGAMLATFGRSRSHEREASVGRRFIPRVVAVAIFGAVAAPIALVWGLQHTSATSASLLLNFEAVFTVLLGWMLFHEHVGRRVAVAVLLMALAGTCLVVGGSADTASVGAGAIAVVLATLAWALDNALTRPLADLDPAQVVRHKSGLGA
jgi:drug/metabolite transporter (DMT)-like permease